MKKIISIQGYKGSGKNEVASMLQFILNTPKIFHNYFLYQNFRDVNYRNDKFQIVSYANTLKEITGALLGVPVSFFEDRNFKENTYVDFTTLSLIERDEITDKKKILTDTKFAKEVKRLDMNLARNYYLSVRQVLQYLGTEIIRHYFGDDTWVLTTLRSEFNKIIISDQRFINEYNKSKENGAFVIHVTRPGCVAGTHASELELKTLEEQNMYDVLIENNGSLKDLFNECKRIIKKSDSVKR